MKSMYFLKERLVLHFLFLIIVFLSLKCSKKDISGTTGPIAVIANDYNIMKNGKIVSTTGFGLGVDDSQHLCNWIQNDSISMILNYPGGLSWGAVFITVGGDPVPPPRPWIDISACTKLAIEMKGASGEETVKVGIKDKDDPDNGSETKKAIKLTQDWDIYIFTLSDFISCDLSKVYVVTEFVFPGSYINKAVTIYIKNISILK